MTHEFDASIPLEAATALPSQWYTDAEYLAAEQEGIFRAHWHWIGRAEQVASPGQFLTAVVAGEPILAVRGEDHVLRGMYNVCRHRAARVACTDAGQASRLRCRYHGWTYNLKGELCGLPEMDGVTNFARADNGLPPIAVATWGPWVFAHLGVPPMSIEAYLKPLQDSLASFSIEALRWHTRRTYDLACNWKVYIDNYLDGGYHVNTLHHSLASVLDYAQYRTEIFPYASLQSTPLRPPDGAREDASAGTVRSGNSAAYWWLFPNLMINVYEGLMDINVVLPLDVNHCRVIFDFYFNADRSDPFCRESIEVSDRIQQEDVEISEDVQRGLASRSYVAGRYSARREVGVHHFHRLVAQSADPKNRRPLS